MAVAYIRHMLTNITTQIVLAKMHVPDPERQPSALQHSDLFLNEVFGKMKCQEMELLVVCHQISLHSEIRENTKRRQF